MGMTLALGLEGRRWAGCIKEAPRLHNRITHHDSDTNLLEFPLETYFENHVVFTVCLLVYVCS